MTRNSKTQQKKDSPSASSSSPPPLPPPPPPLLPPLPFSPPPFPFFIPHKEWREDVDRLERHLTRVTVQAKRVADSMMEEYKAQAAKKARMEPPSSSSTTRTSRAPLAPSSRNNTTSVATGSNAVRREGWVPALTDEEFALLKRHHGCFKCRLAYVDHKRDDCPTGYPTAGNVPQVTEEACRQAYRARKARQQTVPDPSGTSASASISAVAATYAGSGQAKMPSAVIYEESSSEGSDNAGFDVSDPVPSRHLLWRCHINGQEEFPTTVLTMLDDGAHIVLIDAALSV